MFGWPLLQLLVQGGVRPGHCVYRDVTDPTPLVPANRRVIPPQQGRRRVALRPRLRQGTLPHF